MPTPLFPPPYSIRISKRARKPGLRIASGVGLEVVLPEKLQHTDVTALITRHRTWIERHYSRIMKPAPDTPPLEDGFFIAGGSVFITFHPDLLSQEELHQRAKILLPGVITPRLIAQRPLNIALPSPEEQETQPLSLTLALRQWTLTEADKTFRPQLHDLLTREGLRINRCVFKLQKTRWGSCSAKKNININANILFLPEQLARYILIHELSHLYHLNHSNLFWKKVFELEPQALHLDKALRHAKKYLPWHRLP